MDGLPSSTLKAQFLDLLESDEKSLEGLRKVLRIDTTRYRTVGELVRDYEERFGQLSLEKWKFILKRLGHSENVQVLADITGEDDVLYDLNGKPFLAAKQWPRRQHDRVARYTTMNTVPAGGVSVGNQLQGEHKSFECKSGQTGAKEDKELNMSTMSEGTVGKIARTYQTLREESVEKENAMDNAAQGDTDTATDSRIFSAEGTSHVKNKLILSNIQSFSHDGENETSRCKNPAVADGREETRARTPEAPGSSRDLLVTGQQRSCNGYDMPVVGTHSQGDEEQGVNNIGQGSAHAAECCNYPESNSSFAELQEDVERSRLNVSFLVEELRKECSFCTSLWTRCCSLCRQLQASRYQYDQLQREDEQLRRALHHSNVLEDESQQMITRTLEMYLWKAEECNRLKEENRSLRAALVRQMKSKEEGRSVPLGGSREDDVTRNIATSEVEDDAQPGSSNYTQQSDSDVSSEDEHFEDACDDL